MHVSQQQPMCLQLKMGAGSVQALVDRMHTNKQRWVLILDPCIHVSQNYTPYTTGIAQDVFVKDITGKPYLGQVRARKPSQSWLIAPAQCVRSCQAWKPAFTMRTGRLRTRGHAVLGCQSPMCCKDAVYKGTRARKHNFPSIRRP